ncbi:hypothetical protein [Vitiosangium sp. GDMCC 1.1324]|uniref:hypothetical protein n=1 Tax=Vitiosangium sp. (strain GDMCC 1.1324) TaxID=2138576 RepID=UPI000D38D1E8|nr:hypothetical protein [Vitiosangium sp. GDMCC 1.1324]PTL81829.1 hypothetical protein DAT35_23130 [Vitiosangium sp. GDMCC 1.1324]
MKALEFHDLGVEDSLRLSFEATFDQQAALERELEPFLQALEEYAGEWMPDVVEGKRRRKYSRAAIWKALEERRDENSMGLGLYRTKWPALDMAFSLWFPPSPLRLNIWVAIQPLSFFAEEERCRRFVDMVRAWASHYPVTYASANSLAEDQLSGAPWFGRDMQTSIRDGFDKLYEVSWLNVFGPKLVETVGRERMLSTPAQRVEELPNGSILLVTWPIAADFASDEARQAQARAYAHLRPDLDFDTVLRTLRERSATLAPVEPHFPPDMAPLLSRVVDHVPISERQRKIAEFNAWQPPEPDEWFPSESALPSDVNDQALVCRYYSTLAERLVALLHTKVPSVFEAAPESLTDVDLHFWSENFPERFERKNIDEHAIPAISAYMGELLVRHLGGRWVPRKKLGEMQVIVGNRVWLPYVRAHRYMRSRQALLDFSLTQLYRVAERHRG